MANNNTISLQGRLLLGIQLKLVTPTTVAGTLYGIAFTLFCLYVHSLIPRLRDEDRKKQAKFMLGYSIVIMICGLYSLVANAWATQDAYIKHGDYPGGPYLYIISSFPARPAIAVGVVCQMPAIDVLTSVIQIWRVWVIWSATRYAKLVIILPLLCLLTFTAFYVRSITLETTLSVVEILQLNNATQIAGWAIQGASTILCTALISLYLIYQQWHQRKLIGEANGSVGYMSIVAVLIESYALESIWLLLAATLLSYPVSFFFSDSRPYIEIIAYLLVQYRVANGTAYELHREQRNISSLQWNRSEHVTTVQLGETLSEAAGHRRVSAKPEGSDELSVESSMA